ncbi:RNA 2',3'-cyclic phosphodiesterase [Salinicola peritrichatus]|uniref:RNA 2',3'-cyclic phosphodiesterase n=1 Tax=Salinicola peritrichatus TaxID=1267424 RepID=UPI0013A61A8B|nr:RNA 2',3'-cyclic phosphodiesterase [Salinicola peritrichatus]
MTQHHRLFFALWPDETSRRALAAQAQALVSECGGHPLPAGNMHVTLAFLGNVGEARLDALVSLAQNWPPLGGQWRLDRLGHFPKPRIVWAGSRMPSPELVALNSRLWRALANHGFTPPSREFTPHVSLLRQAERPAAQASLTPPITWHYDHLALVESLPEAGGPRYHTLARSAG